VTRSFKNKDEFFIAGWFTHVLFKLGLAEEKDIHPAMFTKIRIHEIEAKIVANARSTTSAMMKTMEKDILWGEEGFEREPEKKSET